MSDAVAVQVVASTGLVLVALLGILAPFVVVYARRLLRRVAAIDGQVSNDHTSNLREDIDGKHTENRDILLTIQRDIAWLMRRQAKTDQRLTDHIETTEERHQP